MNERKPLPYNGGRGSVHRRREESNKHARSGKDAQRDVDDTRLAVLDDVVEQYTDDLRAAAYNIVRDRETADAVLDETVIRLRNLKKPPPLRPDDLLGARRYVMRAVTNVARNRRRDDARRRAREQPLDAEAPPPGASVPSPEESLIGIEARKQKRTRREELRTKFDKTRHALTPRQQAAITLELEGLSREAIAARLAITVNALDKLRSRAFQRLKKELGDIPTSR